jgi:hypothetical protein
MDAAKETPERHKTVLTERAQHTEIPLPRDKEPLRFGSTGAKFARVCVRSAARGNMVSTLRGKATNIASLGSRVQLIHGLKCGHESCGTLARTNSNCKRQKRPLFGEGTPHQQIRNCLPVIKMWPWGPRWVLDT